LPETAPSLESASQAQNILSRMTDLRSATLVARSRISQADDGLKTVQAEMAQIVEETGGFCPTCGSPVKPENLLEHHAHSSTPSERLTA
jgi:hypothetical protein